MNNAQTEFDALFSEAIKHTDRENTKSETIVMRTAQKNLRILQISDYMNACIREPIENECIDTLIRENDTEIITCLAITAGHYPIVPSWNFLSKLILINNQNVDTAIYLWGGADSVHVKTLGTLITVK